MTLDFMSRKRQQELQKVAQDVVDLMNGYIPYSATQALTKVAGDHGLNRDEIRRVSEVLNSTSVLAQVKHASDHGTDDADAPVDLVNADDVITKVYGEDCPKGDKKDDTVDAGKYDGPVQVTKTAEIHPEHMIFDEGVEWRPTPQNKTASSNMDAVRDNSPTWLQLFNKAKAQINQLKIAYEEERDEHTRNKFAAQQALESLNDLLRRNNAPDFSSVEKIAKYLHGKSMNIPCDLAYRACGLRKLGHTRFTGDMPKYAAYTEHADVVSHLVTLKNALANAAFYGAQSEKTAGDLLRAEAAMNRIVMEKQGLDPGMALIASGLNTLTQDEEKAVQSVMPNATPNESLMNQVQMDRVRANLGDLMHEDPVIREFSSQPGAIERAFNDIVTMQPEIASQPLALRAALRRHLTAGGDFSLQEARQIANLNTPQRD